MHRLRAVHCRHAFHKLQEVKGETVDYGHTQRRRHMMLREITTDGDINSNRKRILRLSTAPGSKHIRRVELGVQGVGLTRLHNQQQFVVANGA